MSTFIAQNFHLHLLSIKINTIDIKNGHQPLEELQGRIEKAKKIL